MHVLRQQQHIVLVVVAADGDDVAVVVAVDIVDAIVVAVVAADDDGVRAVVDGGGVAVVVVVVGDAQVVAVVVNIVCFDFATWRCGSQNTTLTTPPSHVFNVAGRFFSLCRSISPHFPFCYYFFNTCLRYVFGTRFRI